MMLRLSAKFWVFLVSFFERKLGGYFVTVIVCVVVSIAIAWNGDGGRF